MISSSEGTAAISARTGVPEPIITNVLTIVQASVIYLCSATAVAAWEWIINLPKEWNGIWRQPWSFINVVYIVSRYGVFLGLGISIWLWTGEFTVDECSKLFHLIPAFFILTELSAETIMMVRVYALSGRKLWVILPLAIVLVGYVAVDLYISIAGMEPVPIFVERDYCIPTGGANKAILAYWIIPMAFDFYVTALMLYFIYPYYKTGGFSGIMRVFVREGLLYFLVIFLANALNVAFFVQTDFTGQAINAGFSLVMSSVMSCRLVLSLRDSDASGHTTIGRTGGAEHGSGFWARSGVTAPPSYASPISNNPLPKASGPALPLSRMGDDDIFSEKAVGALSDAYVLTNDRTDSPPQTSSGIRVETTVHVATD